MREAVNLETRERPVDLKARAQIERTKISITGSKTGSRTRVYTQVQHSGTTAQIAQVHHTAKTFIRRSNTQQNMAKMRL
jgi:hypothetical protein